jgi:peptide/nickel transport system permease protein
VKRYVLRRLLAMVPTFLGITLVTFAVAQLAPGDPLQLDPESAGASSAAEQANAQFRHKHGLDLPLPVQYGRWLGKVVQLDFGRSLHDGRPVRALLAETLPRTLLLSALALLFALVTAIPIGTALAVRHGRPLARVVSSSLFIAYALPGFWVAVMVLLALATDRGVALFPLQGLSSVPATASFAARAADLAWHLVLPVFCLAYPFGVVLARHVKTAMREALAQDYVRAARARGVPERVVIFRHALRNSLLPVVTLLGLALPQLVGGSVIVERVFGIPGMGLLAFDAIGYRDYPVVMGVATLAAIVTLVSVLIADLLYAAVDPRIRLGEGA